MRVWGEFAALVSQTASQPCNTYVPFLYLDAYSSTPPCSLRVSRTSQTCSSRMITAFGLSDPQLFFLPFSCKVNGFRHIS